MKEIWKDILGYKGHYQASNLGRIKSLKNRKNNGILSDKSGDARYLGTMLCKDGIRIRYSIHRLIAETFIPNPENKSQINHKDGNRYNNFVGNLEWVTASENGKHAYRNGLAKTIKGEKHVNSKLKNDDVILIRKLYNMKLFKMETIAHLFNISTGHLNDIVHYRRWGWLN